MLNDKYIGEAIAQAAEKRPGRKAGIARSIGISPSTLGRIEYGDTGEIEHEQWCLLYPILSPFLPHSPDGLPLPRYRPPDELDKIRPGETAAHSPGQCQRCAGLSDEALKVARRWQALCPQQQGMLLERLLFLEQDAADKKDSRFASRETKKTA